MLEITVETFKMQVVGLKAKQTRAVALQGGSHKSSSSSSSSNCRVHVFFFHVGHFYMKFFLCSQPDIEDVSRRGMAGSERGGQKFVSGNSGLMKIGSLKKVISGLNFKLALIE